MATIFIVGMPRSGTTLVERVLAASDSVYAGGELHDFIGQFVYQYGLLPERQNLPAIFGKAHQFDYRKIGKGYVDADGCQPTSANVRKNSQTTHGF